MTRPTRTGRTRRAAGQADGLPVEEDAAVTGDDQNVAPDMEEGPDQEKEAPGLPAAPAGRRGGEPSDEAPGPVHPEPPVADDNEKQKSADTQSAPPAGRVSPTSTLMTLAAAAQIAGAALTYRAYFNQMLGGVYAEETVGILAGYLSYSADMLVLLCPPAALMAVAAGTGDKGRPAALAAVGIDAALALSAAAMLSEASGQSAIKLSAAFLVPALLAAASLIVGRRRV